MSSKVNSVFIVHSPVVEIRLRRPDSSNFLLIHVASAALNMTPMYGFFFGCKLGRGMEQRE